MVVTDAIADVPALQPCTELAVSITTLTNPQPKLVLIKCPQDILECTSYTHVNSYSFTLTFQGQVAYNGRLVQSIPVVL